MRPHHPSGSEPPFLHFTFCDACGKRAYSTRKDARKASKRAQHGPMSAYRCPATVDGADALWHVGHLRADVRQGYTSKDEAYGPGRRIKPRRPRPNILEQDVTFISISPTGAPAMEENAA